MEPAKGTPQTAARKLLRVATRCNTVEDFIATFFRFVDEHTVTIITSHPRTPGTKQPFAMQLRGGDDVMRGEVEVIECTPGQRGKPGSMKLRLVQLDLASRKVHRELLAARARAPQETRTPGSSYTLPANPLAELPDEALAYFLECTLYEETGVFKMEPDLDALVSSELPPLVLPKHHQDTAQFLKDAPADESTLPAPIGARPLVAPTFVPPEPMPEVARFSIPPPRKSRGWIWGVVAVVLGVGGFGAGWVLRPKTEAKVATASVAPTTTAPAVAAPAASAPVAPAVTAPPPAPAPASSTCTATITTESSGAPVTWGDRSLGTTPITSAAIPCGPATVTVDHPRYEKVTRQVDAKGAETLAIPMQRPAGKLSLSSSPPGASFTVNGKSVGSSADVLAFTQVTVTATLAGHKPWSQKVYVKGRTASVTAKLEKQAKGKTPKR